MGQVSHACTKLTDIFNVSFHLPTGLFAGLQNYMTDSVKCQEAVQSFAEAHRKSVLGSDLKVLKRNDTFSDDALNPSAGRNSQAVSLPSAAANSPVGSSASSSKQALSKGSEQRSTSFATKAASRAQANAKSCKADTTSPSRLAHQATSAHGRAQSLTVKRGAVHKGAPQEIDPAHAAVAEFDVSVFNCLSCGKVCCSHDLVSPFCHVLSCGASSKLKLWAVA